MNNSNVHCSYRVDDGITRTKLLFAIHTTKIPKRSFKTLCTSSLLLRPPKFLAPQSSNLRERHKLGVPWPTIRADIILGKSLFGIKSPGLIEINATALHDLQYFSLSSLIQASSRIPPRPHWLRGQSPRMIGQLPCRW